MMWVDFQILKKKNTQFQLHIQLLRDILPYFKILKAAKLFDTCQYLLRDISTKIFQQNCIFRSA